MEDFYVYEWFNIDTEEVFYVGKGRKNRYKDIVQRNNYFKNYYNKYNCDVRKIQTELQQDEAFKLEKELITKYKKISQCKCNITNGGEGTTFPKNSRNSLLRRLRLSKYCEKDYYELEEMTTEELMNEDIERIENKDSYCFLKALDIYDDNGDLNIGWECFED